MPKLTISPARKRIFLLCLCIPFISAVSVFCGSEIYRFLNPIPGRTDVILFMVQIVAASTAMMIVLLGIISAEHVVISTKGISGPSSTHRFRRITIPLEKVDRRKTLYKNLYANLLQVEIWSLDSKAISVHKILFRPDQLETIFDKLGLPE